MKDEWKIIKELESDNSRLFKESVIEKNLNDTNLSKNLGKEIKKFTTGLI